MFENLLTLKHSPSSSRPVFQVFTVPLSSLDLQQDNISVITQRDSPEASPSSLNTPSYKRQYQPVKTDSAMNQHSIVSLNASGDVRLLNLTQLVVEHRQLLQLSRRKEEESYFVDYIPPARDAITLPRNVVYVLVGVVLVIVATYAIVGHLIKDLMHDLAGNPP